MQGIYLVTGECRFHDLESVVAQAVRAGVSAVQLREKEADTRTFLDKATRIKASLSGSGIPLIINDRVDIALASGADGVHLGQSDLPYAAARRLLGPRALIGLSVETLEEVMAAQDLDLAYLGVSPVFATPTKTDTKTPWGLEGLAQIRAVSRHRLVAIGGMNRSNIPEAVRAGAHAIAVVSAICAARDPFTATRELTQAFQSCFQGDHP